MDPRNGTARIIFERVQEEKRKQSLSSRINDLLGRSNEAAQQREFPKAIAHLQAALTVDPANDKVLSRIQELRNLELKQKEAARLASVAGSEFQQGRLTEAFAHASEAISHDPDNFCTLGSCSTAFKAPRTDGRVNVRSMLKSCACAG